MQCVTASLQSQPPVRRPETVVEQLLRLDSSRRPGLFESEFKRLFAKCSCGLIMTRRVFKDHICIPALAAPPVVIDLTSDVSDEEDIN